MAGFHMPSARETSNREQAKVLNWVYTFEGMTSAKPTPLDFETPCHDPFLQSDERT